MGLGHLDISSAIFEGAHVQCAEPLKEELQSVGRVLAAIWLWCFVACLRIETRLLSISANLLVQVVLIVLLLVNMVLAILMDAYGAARQLKWLPFFPSW